ncbi:MAG: Crp/Fnr family transcriptional regulator [Bacteroidota bacterium]
MKKLKINLQKHLELSETDWQKFKERINMKAINAGTQLVNEGQIATHLYFIDIGLLRVYHLEDGKEVNTYFACDGQFISCYASFVAQTPSFEYLEAIEDSMVFAISYENLSQLYSESSGFERIGRILAEKNYLCLIDRFYSMQTKTATGKYLDFIENHEKKIVQRVPQYQIASFLGIAPESLSRVRKHLLTS